MSVSVEERPWADADIRWRVLPDGGINQDAEYFADEASARERADELDAEDEKSRMQTEGGS